MPQSPIAPGTTGAALAVRGAPGTLVDVTTDGIRPAERLAFWRDGVLSRLEARKALADDRPFRGRLRRVIGDGADLVEHASDAILAVRTPQKCRQDSVDDIALEFMVDCAHATLDQGAQRRILAGDLYCVDYAQPVEVIRSRHSNLSIILSRRKVRALLGHDLPPLVGVSLAPRGIGAVLRSHLATTLAEAAHMTPAQRVAAIAAAADMALVALTAEQQPGADVEQFEQGFYYAACRLIEARYADPELSPTAIAATLACSRASLYRVFSRHGESVAAKIWSTRLARAALMLASAGSQDLLISEIAFRCGFVDQPTFNRMFKRQYGYTPGEARAPALRT